MKRKITITALIIILLFAGCSEQSDRLTISKREFLGEIYIALDLGKSKRDEPPYDPRTLLPTNNTIVNRLVMFMDMHPGVEVRVMHRGLDTSVPDDYRNRFSEVPDILVLSPEEVRWQMMNKLQELSFYMENSPAEELWDEDYMSLINNAKMDGQQYLLPISSDPMVVYYAPLIFKYLDIVPPSKDWTWNDFVGIAIKLNESGFRVGLWKSTNDIEHFIIANGGSYHSLDGNEFDGYVNSEETLNAFQQYFEKLDPLLDYWREYYNSFHNDMELPVLGISRASKMFALLHTDNMEYEFATMPLTANGQRVNTTMLTGLVMTNEAQNKEIVWELMRFIVGEDPMSSAVVRGLAGWEVRLPKHKPPKYNELIEQMRIESAWSIPSSAYLHYFYNSGIWTYQPDEWMTIPIAEENIKSYLNELVQRSEKNRDAMMAEAHEDF